MAGNALRSSLQSTLEATPTVYNNIDNRRVTVNNYHTNVIVDTVNIKQAHIGQAGSVSIATAAHDTNIGEAHAVAIGTTLNDTNFRKAERVAIKTTSRDTRVNRTDFFANNSSIFARRTQNMDSDDENSSDCSDLAD